MVTRPELLIAFAVQRCLEQCDESPCPLACLASFLCDLEDLGWHETDIAMVEWRVANGLRDTLSQVGQSDVDFRDDHRQGAALLVSLVGHDEESLARSSCQGY
jgi:hypothetical protein